MSDQGVNGVAPPQLSGVREVFEHHFATGEELGARFTVCVDGEVVLDLCGGWADRAKTRPFAEDTLTGVFSTTKAIGAMMLARAVDQGKLSYDWRVAEVWPAFADGGKEQVTVAQMLSHQAG